MNLLHIISSMDPKTGGTSQVIRSTYKEFQNLGVDVEIACLDSLDSQFLKNDASLKIYALGESISIWQYNSQLKKWLEQNLSRFDVIMVHGLWLYHSYITTKIIDKMRKLRVGAIPRVLVMPHGMLDPWFQSASTRRFKALRNIIYWHLVEKNVINSADGVFFTCQQELELSYLTFDGYSPKNVYNVGMGIAEPPEFDSKMEIEFYERFPLLRTEKFWLFLSRIDSKKGLDLLILAYQNLLSKQSNISNFPCLVIVGPVTDFKFYYKIQDSIRPYYKGKIVFTGMLNGLSKWGAFYKSECFILPSHQENFGIAVVEALACGIPVLISDKVNICREVESYESGIVFSDNLLSIESSLEKFLHLDADTKKQMSISAVKTFMSHFKVKDSVLKIIAACSKLLS